MTKALMAISCPLTTQLEPEITGDLELGELVHSRLMDNDTVTLIHNSDSLWHRSLLYAVCSPLRSL